METSSARMWCASSGQSRPDSVWERRRLAARTAAETANFHPGERIRTGQNVLSNGSHGVFSKPSQLSGLCGGGRSPDRTSFHLKFPANREINRERLSLRRKPLYIIVFNQSFVLKCGRAIPLLGSAAGNISPKIAPRHLPLHRPSGFGRASLGVRMRMHQRTRAGSRLLPHVLGARSA